MTYPSVYQLIRNRAEVTWLILIAAPPTSFAIGVEHGTGAAVVIVVLGIAAIKVRLIGLDFMEVRQAPIPLRVMFETYCVVLRAVLSGLYLLLQFACCETVSVTGRLRPPPETNHLGRPARRAIAGGNLKDPSLSLRQNVPSDECPHHHSRRS
ncbi:cytochrome C oxidase subunit IV family protein [Mycobacterium sp. RTGN3]|uniref:cytochrome C oxidase subunit IV family protein n=1 Tax=unclassified Mycobacterium TaxID=2642494 RepID=UPI0039AF83C1